MVSEKVRPHQRLSRKSNASYALALVVSGLLHAGAFVYPEEFLRTKEPTAFIRGNGSVIPHSDAGIPLSAPEPEAQEEVSDNTAQAEAGASENVAQSTDAPAPLVSELGRPDVQVSLDHLAVSCGGAGFVTLELSLAKPGFGDAFSEVAGPRQLRKLGGARGSGLALTPPPQYPPKAREEGREGEVSLLVRVDETGRAIVLGIKSSSGHADLDQAAIFTVQTRWRFMPEKQAKVRQVLIRFDLRSTEQA